MDSTRSSFDYDAIEASKPRRLSKPIASSRIDHVSTNSSTSSNGTGLRKGSTLSSMRTVSSVGSDTRDRQTGETKDHTNMLHSLAHDFDAPTGGKQPIFESSEPAIPATKFVSQFPNKVWKRVITFLDLADEACLYLSCKPFQALADPSVLKKLNDPENFPARMGFLHRLNYLHPDHLLCYICGIYHLRTQKGSESLKPSNIANPLYDCPYATSQDPAEKVSRHRITFGRNLPYPFVQLMMRHHHNGPTYGIDHKDLSFRRYKDRAEVGNWNHQRVFAIIDDHLYMRVVSYVFAQPNLPAAGKRHLMHSREDFLPFFSVCAHWRDGELMPSCRCALDHIPAPLSGSGVNRVASEVHQRLSKPKSQIISQCDQCKPLRRCPECPSEYLIEVRLQEDRAEKDPTKLFKHALVVTRWVDLGDGSGPAASKEWAAICGDLDDLPTEERYDSNKILGRRAINGVFESYFNPEQIPPQRLISLNPDGERLGEKGHNWY